jgi:hypothetical protein
LTSRADLREVSESTAEWDSFFAEVANALLPREGFVAFLGEEDWRSGSVYTDLAARVYLLEDAADVVADTITKSAPTILPPLACSVEEGAFHRDEWRYERVDGAAARRLALSASLFYGDYGGVATVDVRVVPDVLGGTLVVACFYVSERATQCDAFVASLSR